MKSNLEKKILKLVVAEILIQIGFERTTDQAMNLCVDLLVFYLENTIKHSMIFGNCPAKHAIANLFFKFYYSEQYQKEELYQFAIQQAQIRRSVKEKIEDANNLLYMLKVLPPGIYFRNTHIKTNTLTIEEKNSPVKIIEKANLDEFLYNFINECNGSPSDTSSNTKPEYWEDSTLNISNIIEKETPEKFTFVSSNKTYNILYEEDIILEEIVRLK